MPTTMEELVAFCFFIIGNALAFFLVNAILALAIYAIWTSIENRLRRTEEREVSLLIVTILLVLLFHDMLVFVLAVDDQYGGKPIAPTFLWATVYASAIVGSVIAGLALSALIIHFGFEIYIRMAKKQDTRRDTGGVSAEKSELRRD